MLLMTPPQLQLIMPRVLLTLKNKAEHVEKSNMEEKDGIEWQAVYSIWKQYPAVCLCPVMTPVSMNTCVHSQHGAVSLNMMTVTVPDQAHCLHHICSYNKDERVNLET